jgi:hypothetical protein
MAVEVIAVDARGHLMTTTGMISSPQAQRLSAVAHEAPKQTVVAATRLLSVAAERIDFDQFFTHVMNALVQIADVNDTELLIAADSSYDALLRVLAGQYCSRKSRLAIRSGQRKCPVQRVELDGLEEVLAELRELDPRPQAAYLLAPNRWLAGASPLDAPRKGNRADVFETARMYDEHIAARPLVEHEAPGAYPEPPIDLAERRLLLREIVNPVWVRGHPRVSGPPHFIRARGRCAPS